MTGGVTLSSTDMTSRGRDFRARARFAMRQHAGYLQELSAWHGLWSWCFNVSRRGCEGLGQHMAIDRQSEDEWCDGRDSDGTNGKGHGR